MGQAQSTVSAYECASPAPQDKWAAGGGWLARGRDNNNNSNTTNNSHNNKASKSSPISGKARRRQPKGGPDSSGHVRKLSIVSNRNIQLLSMRPRSEQDNYAEGLHARRRSSLINLILGAPSSGPRFSDDLCSLGSHMSFGIDYFPDAVGLQAARVLSYSTNSSLVCPEDGRIAGLGQHQTAHANSRGALPSATGAGDVFVSGHRRRRSSLGSLASSLEVERGMPSPASRGQTFQSQQQSQAAIDHHGESPSAPQQSEPAGGRAPNRQLARRCPSLSSIFMASIDLTNQPSDEQRAQTTGHLRQHRVSQSSISDVSRNNSIDAISDGEQTMPHAESVPAGLQAAQLAAGGLRINQAAAVPMLHRSGSELVLYSSGSTTSASSGSSHQHHQQPFDGRNPQYKHALSGHVAESRQSTNPRSATGCFGALDRSSFGSFKKMPPTKQASDDRPTGDQPRALIRETKLIIMLQVCLPFILAGFGNMAAGLVLNKLSHWQSFQQVPIFFVLLPSFVGMKGNIEMTLASRLSTLANLNLLTSGHQRRHAYLSNLILILSQAIGLSLFAVIASMLCGFFTSKLEVSFLQTLHITALVVLPCALITAVALVFMASIVMWWSIWLANWIQVNPDNLSTLLAAMYGDVSCVLTYGLFADLMHSFYQQNVHIWPLLIICIALGSWPFLWYMAYKYAETRELSLSSMPPMLTGIVVSLGSGTVLSLVVSRYSRIALYQPVVNGFGANLIAVQASRVSTWLWCSALRRLSKPHTTLDMIDSRQSQKLTSASSKLFNMSGLPARKQQIGDMNATSLQDGAHKSTDEKSAEHGRIYRLISSQMSRGLGLLFKAIRVILWSFMNQSPNSVAARLLLIMLLPAHTLYFFVIWMLSPNYVQLTWPFYAVYMALCLTQVFILLLVCEPLMTLLMRRHLDPDIFGISILMALADLVGTLCLTGAFSLLAHLGDPNAF